MDDKGLSYIYVSYFEGSVLTSMSDAKGFSPEQFLVWAQLKDQYAATFHYG